MLEKHSHVYTEETIVPPSRGRVYVPPQHKPSEPTLEDIMKAEGIEAGITFN